MRAIHFASGYYLVQVVFTLALALWMDALANISSLDELNPLISKFTIISVTLSAFVFWGVGLMMRRRASALVAVALGGLCYVTTGMLWILVQWGAPNTSLAGCSVCAVFMSAVAVSLLGYAMQANNTVERDAGKNSPRPSP